MKWYRIDEYQPIQDGLYIVSSAKGQIGIASYASGRFLEYETERYFILYDIIYFSIIEPLPIIIEK